MRLYVSIRRIAFAGLSPWVAVLSMLYIILHLVFSTTLGLHRDELLYFSLGQHPAAGYASVPPLTGLAAWLVSSTLGYSLLAVRVLPAILGGMMVLLGAMIAREMKGGHYAQVLASLSLMVTPYCLRCFYLFEPVCTDVVLWAVIFWLALKWINTHNDRWLLVPGLVLGLGMLNKYIILLLPAGMAFAFLFFPHTRVVFSRRALYLAILLALLVMLPNLIWQIVHAFPALTHLRALNDSQLVHVSRMSFLTDQLFLAAVAQVAVIPGILFLAFHPAMRPYRPLLITSLIVLLLLWLLRGKSYYTIGLFVLWIASGAVWWERILRRKWLRVVLPVTLVILTLPILPVGIPVFGKAKLAGFFSATRDRFGADAALRWESGRIHSLPQDYADMLGWEEMARATAHAWQQVPDKRRCMIYAENYGQAGAVMVHGKHYRLPEPVCFSESFFYWFPRKLDHEITSLIYINDEPGEDVAALFNTCQKIGQVSDTLAREYGTGVWLFTNPRSSFKNFWESRVPQVTDPFR